MYLRAYTEHLSRILAGCDKPMCIKQEWVLTYGKCELRGISGLFSVPIAPIGRFWHPKSVTIWRIGGFCLLFRGESVTGHALTFEKAKGMASPKCSAFH